MKITKSQIIEIEKLNKQGIKLKDIAKKFKVNISTISYYLNKQVRIKQIMDCFNKKSISEKRAIWRKKGKYINEWTKKKYASDEKFRNKCKLKSKNYYEKKRSKK